ncbi:MAG: nickel-dependent hydrogenase large subunit [Betaproteobacteria bacterium]|nr:nickel-dependent hydrogenase large subunit [Betaproteobacteria bacterium]
MTERLLGPFNRVEGDLEVRLEIADGQIQSAQVVSPLYRGFETMLPGRAPLDALVIVPRICGICSVSQSAAAVTALRQLTGLTPPDNGRLAECLITAGENVADHLTHFYLFFMPDLARPAYAARPWHGRMAERFEAVKGQGAAEFLAARAAFMHLQGLMAGKWPHTLTLQPGGSARPLHQAECLQLTALLRSFRRFLEQRVYGGPLEAFAALAAPEELNDWRRRHPGDLSLFLEAAEDLDLARLGRCDADYLSFGVYEAPEGRLFPAGVWSGGRLAPLAPERISEDLSHAWMRSETLPDADKPGAYTWCKAPRYGGQVMQTGALARQLVAGQPLLHRLVAEQGGGVLARVLARHIEVARLLPEMEAWAARLIPGQPWCAPTPEWPRQGAGVGLTEAARGSLGHWLEVEEGRIRRYQIIAPTTWNFSPRDEAGVPGALEQALTGLPVAADDPMPVNVQHVVRSFDPCMVCTVH